jgi:hypothetical protein
MDFYRMLIIVTIAILFACIMIILLNQRQKILQMNHVVEGMVTPADEVAALTTRYNPVTIQNVSPSIQKLPLRELCIKSSYSSAWSGSYNSTDMIKLILSRGYRYLDISIYYGDDSTPYLFYSTDSNTIDTNNTIPLDNAFKTIAASAFSNDSPNPSDPLFIELRIVPDSANKIYDSVAQLIKSNFVERLYLDSNNRAILIDHTTTLKNLMGKIILLMNVTNNENFQSNSQDFSFAMNGVLGINPFQLKTYRQFKPFNKKEKVITTYKIVNDNMPPTTNLKEYITMIPEITESYNDYPIPNLFEVVYKDGIQNLVVPFYTVSPMVLLYENFFNDQRAGFVPMAKVLGYANSYFSDMKNIPKPKINHSFLQL